MYTVCVPGDPGSPKTSPGADGCEPLWELSLSLFGATDALNYSPLSPSPTSGFLAKVCMREEKRTLCRNVINASIVRKQKN